MLTEQDFIEDFLQISDLHDPPTTTVAVSLQSEQAGNFTAFAYLSCRFDAYSHISACPPDDGGTVSL